MAEENEADAVVPFLATRRTRSTAVGHGGEHLSTRAREEGGDAVTGLTGFGRWAESEVRGPSRHPSFPPFLNLFSKLISNTFFEYFRSIFRSCPKNKSCSKKILYNFVLRCNPRI